MPDNLSYKRQWAKNHIESRRKSVRKTRAKYRADGRCVYCGGHRAEGLMSCRPCNGAHKAASLRYVHETRAVAIGEYGGKCACCGETETRFLTIDHGNNDGAKHRREHGVGTGAQFYTWLKRNNYPRNIGIQVLCWNCNCGKRDNGGICPHVAKVARPIAV